MLRIFQGFSQLTFPAALEDGSCYHHDPHHHLDAHFKPEETEAYPTEIFYPSSAYLARWGTNPGRSKAHPSPGEIKLFPSISEITVRTQHFHPLRC